MQEKMPTKKDFDNGAEGLIGPQTTERLKQLVKDVGMLLLDYHKVALNDFETRSKQLKTLATLILSVLKQEQKESELADYVWAVGGFANKHALAFDKQFMAAFLAKKKADAKANVGANWNKVRKVARLFVGSSPHGALQTIQHHHVSLENPVAIGNYWLEANDPKHRSSGHSKLMQHHFQTWMNTPTSLSFFDWLDEMAKAGVKVPEEQVIYMAPNQRWRYWVVFEDGLMKRAQRNPKTRVLLNTRNCQTAHSGKGWAVWVCSPSGAFYDWSHTVDKFHHSTFLAGRPVLCAGEWILSGGMPLLVSHKTGHYRAGPANLLNAIRLLNQRTDISRTIALIQTFGEKNERKFVNAKELLNKNGKFDQCEAMPDTVVKAALQLSKTGKIWPI